VNPALVARDPQFAAAAAAGPVAWFVFAAALGVRPDPAWAFFADPVRFFGLAVAWPILEEGVFRGVIQPALLRTRGGAREAWGVTTANVATSVLFAAAHLAAHAPAWALAAVVPSLVIGDFRDRHGSAVPAAALHVFYNCGWFLTLGM
jgi:membrane protease YdiL (CAAX protease family)